MADIDVERKRSPTWIWWLLGLILLAVLIWALTRGGDDAETITPAPVAGPVVEGEDLAALPAELQTFESQCTTDAGTPTTDMGAEHDFTVTCLQRLRDALGAIAVRDTVGGVDVQQQMDDYEQAVNDLEASAADAATHSNLTRTAAMAGATVMEGMRDAYFQAASDVDEAAQGVRTAAEGINAQTALLEQRDAVRGFFRESADALRAMWQGFGATTI